MRRAKISRQQVLDAAVEIVDRDGLAGLTMRRLGQSLGVEAMSLYRHVANKGDLLDAVHATILASMQLPPRAGDPREDLAALAGAFRAALQNHPRAAALFATRPAVGGSLRYVEHVLAVLEEAGLEPTERIYALNTLVAFVVGHVLSELGAEGLGASHPYRSLDEKSCPTLVRTLKAASGQSRDEEFAFGLDRLIAGIARDFA